MGTMEERSDVAFVNMTFDNKDEKSTTINNNEVDDKDQQPNDHHSRPKFVRIKSEPEEILSDSPDITDPEPVVIRIDDADEVIQEVKGNGQTTSDLRFEKTLSVDEDDILFDKRRSSTPGNLDDLKWYEWITSEFKRIAGQKGHITLKDFKDALQIKKSFLAERFFEIFDEDNSGSIELIELMTGLKVITRGTSEEKLQFLFKVYDVDGNGVIDREELKLQLRTCMEESCLSLGEENIDKMTDAVFEAADVNNDGLISYEEWHNEISKYPNAVDKLTIGAARWLKPQTEPEEQKTIKRHFTYDYLRNNIRKAIFLLLYILVNIALAISAGFTYRLSNGWIIVARICGMNLNFNGMFILLLMLRKSLTYVRMSKIGSYLPLDQNIFFHKMVGVVIAVYSVIHTGAHIGNAVVVAQADDDVVNATSDITAGEILFTTKAGIGWVDGSAFITGWLLSIVLAIMVICSMAWVRRSGRFEVFYWTHTLYVIFWFLLILHGPNFWKWFIVPGILFLGEKFFRSKLIKRVRYGKNYIEEVTLLPSSVTHLQIKCSDKFQFKPGDYVFIQVPVIAKREWHPFTISSAPEMTGSFWLHVRSCGHWTKQLNEYFQELDPGEGNVSEEDEEDRKITRNTSRKRSIYKTIKDTFSHGDKERDSVKRDLAIEKRKQRKHKRVRVPCSIDGPYGTGCREVMDTEHAVLIGAGIGVTPMASILQSIMYRYKASKRKCPQCDHQFYGEISDHAMKLKKVDFIWINRDQKAFEWFIGMLSQIEIQQAEMEQGASGMHRIIDIHLFMTALKSKDDVRGIGLQLAFELLRKKYDNDLITGLKTQTQAGRPDWNQVFTKIKESKKGKVKVFFCGAPALGQLIKLECEKFKFAFSKENF